MGVRYGYQTLYYGTKQVFITSTLQRYTSNSETAERVWDDSNFAYSWSDSGECYVEDFTEVKQILPLTSAAYITQTKGDGWARIGTYLNNYTVDSPLVFNGGKMYCEFTEDSQWGKVVVTDDQGTLLGEYRIINQSKRIVLVTNYDNTGSGVRAVRICSILSSSDSLYVEGVHENFLSAQFNQASLNALNSSQPGTQPVSDNPGLPGGADSNTDNITITSSKFSDFTLAEFPLNTTPANGALNTNEIYYPLDAAYLNDYDFEHQYWITWAFQVYMGLYESGRSALTQKAFIAAAQNKYKLGTDLLRYGEKNYDGTDLDFSTLNQSTVYKMLVDTDDEKIRISIPGHTGGNLGLARVRIERSIDDGNTWNEIYISYEYNVSGTSTFSGETAVNMYLSSDRLARARWKNSGTDPITGETHEAGELSPYKSMTLVTNGFVQNYTDDVFRACGRGAQITPNDPLYTGSYDRNIRYWSGYTQFDVVPAEAMCYIDKLIEYGSIYDPSNDTSTSDLPNDDPNPDGETNGTDGGRGDNNFPDENPETIDVGIINAVSAVNSGIIHVYNPTATQVASLVNEMNSGDVWTNLRKFFNGNPMDAFISLHLLPYQVTASTSPSPVQFGSFTSTVAMPTVVNQYDDVAMGEVFLNIPWAGHEYLAFAPHTNVSIFLPFIGIRPLDVNDVMGRSLKLVYHWDCLTGKCIAELRIYHNGEWYNRYTWEGSGMMKYPLVASDHTAWLSSIVNVLPAASQAFSGFSTGNPAQAISGVTNVVSNAVSTAQNIFTHKPEVGGGVSSAGGFLAYRQPYLIITEPDISFPYNYPRLMGKVSNIFTHVSDQRDKFVKFKSIDINGISCTTEEFNMIKSTLYGGCYV